jgi:hypothetical protein
MSAASVAVLRKGRNLRVSAGSSHLFPELAEKKVEGDHELEMLMLDGYELLCD